MNILAISPQYPGACHDAFIWRNSTINVELEKCFNNGDHNTWLLGDSGYPQQPWLMTPVLNAQNGSAEERYNVRHASARNCVERCFGVLKGRFRCLLGERKLRYNPNKVSSIIVACAVLHNICIKDRQNDEYFVNVLNEVQEAQIEMDFNNNNNVDGFRAREELIARYFR